MKTIFSFLLAVIILGAGFTARAEDIATVKLTIKNHKFDPAELHIPANVRVNIDVTNLDPVAEEFDSSDLQIEKVIAGNSQGTIHLHPLDPGTYKFVGEYHPSAAQGIVVAK